MANHWQEASVTTTREVAWLVRYAEGDELRYETLADARSAFARDARLGERPVGIEEVAVEITTRVTRWVPEVAHVG